MSHILNINFLNNKFSGIVLLIMVALYSVAFSSLFLFRHRFFSLHTDTGSYEQSIWNTIHGNIMESSLAVTVYPINSIISAGKDILETIDPFIFSTSHINIIAILIAPLYAMFPYTDTLLILASITLASGAIPVYFIAKKELNNNGISLILAFSYLLYPALQAANIVDFNYLVFVVPFLLTAFYFFRTAHWKLYWIFVVLSLTVRTEVALSIFFLGVAAFFYFKKRKIGLISMAIGLITFFISFSALQSLPIPLFAGNFSVVGQGAGITGILNTLITNPQIIYEHVVTLNAGKYIFQIFSHTGFLVFVNPILFIISFTDLAKNLLTTPDHARIMWNHYQLLLIPGIFISTIFSIKTILSRFSSKRNYVLFFLGVILIFFALASNTTFSPAPLISVDYPFERIVVWEFLNFECCSDYTGNNSVVYPFLYQYESVNKAIDIIPHDASVSSQDIFVSHLSKRSSLHLFPLYYNTTDYVLIVEKPTARLNMDLPQELQDKYISRLQHDGNHEIIFKENGLLLFKKLDN
jgi:uncharacterized membrane protein